MASSYESQVFGQVGGTPLSQAMGALSNTGSNYRSSKRSSERRSGGGGGKHEFENTAKLMKYGHELGLEKMGRQFEQDKDMVTHKGVVGLTSDMTLHSHKTDEDLRGLKAVNRMKNVTNYKSSTGMGASINRLPPEKKQPKQKPGQGVTLQVGGPSTGGGGSTFYNPIQSQPIQHDGPQVFPTVPVTKTETKNFANQIGAKPPTASQSAKAAKKSAGLTPTFQAPPAL